MLACKKCGSTDTLLRSAKELAHEIKDPTFATASSGVCGNPATISIIMTLVGIVGKTLDWLKARAQSEQMIVYCKSCHYWERV